MGDVEREGGGDHSLSSPLTTGDAASPNRELEEIETHEEGKGREETGRNEGLDRFEKKVERTGI